MVQVREALEASWEPGTARLEVRDPDRPALDQCYPTARVFQLLFPQFEIAEGLVQTGTAEEKHLRNVVPSDLVMPTSI